MNKNFLDPERSEILFNRMNREFPETIERSYNRNLETGHIEALDSKTSYAFTHEFIAPVFTLADLLDFIGTDCLIDNDECFVDYMPMIIEGERIYAINWFRQTDSECVKTFTANTLLEAAFECYMWMFDNLDELEREANKEN